MDTTRKEHSNCDQVLYTLIQETRQDGIPTIIDTEAHSGVQRTAFQ